MSISESGYAPLYGLQDHDGDDASEGIIVGDLVHVGPNRGPSYSILGLSCDKAWVKNMDTGKEDIINRNRCRPTNAGPH